MIEAQINDKPALLELDTGSFTTTLTPQAAKRLGLHEDLDRSERFRGTLDNPVELYGIGGARSAHVLMARSFALGTIHGRNFHILTAELGAQSSDGLLSTDLLQKYDIDLDFPGRQVRIFTARGSCTRPAVLLQPPLYVVPLLQMDGDPLPHVHILIDGHRLVAQIDTGAPGTAIYRHAARQLGVQDAELAADRHITLNGIGPTKVDAAVHVFKSVSLGDLTLKNMQVAILDDRQDDQVDVLLGADFQQKIHLWISNSAHALVMQYPPLPSPALSGTK